MPTQEVSYCENSPLFTETTRICPFPFPIWKTCTENIELTDFDGRAVQIEKGTKIILPTTALHKHPDFYIDAELFNPNRFDESTAKTLNGVGVFTPFGNGPRICMGTLKIYCFQIKEIIYKICIGMRWAVALMKAVLCALVDNFEFSVQETPSKPSSQTGMLFFSDNAVQLKFQHLQ